jgi:BolA family transcriptional regulator, general stress-responsive regulator
MSSINSQRMLNIETAIRAALAPAEITVSDESHLHAGHAGAKTGMGHFHVYVVSEAFDGQRMLRRHRLIYDAVGSLMQTDIHALRIDAKTPAEVTLND